MNNDEIIKTNWYHGTKSDCFENWLIPPPSIPDEPSIHKGIFFTSNIEYAKFVGKNIAQISLSKEIKILNTVHDKENTEILRKSIIEKNSIFTPLNNFEYDYWHKGWLSGDVLRMDGSEKDEECIELRYEIDKLKQKYMDEPYQFSEKVAQNISYQLMTRCYIETICQEAKQLEFDAIFGYEVDKHSIHGKKQAQPWLCIFDNSKISKPTWLPYSDPNS